MTGEGKIRVCLNLPIEVYQRLCERAENEKQPMCDIVVNALAFDILEKMKASIDG